MVINNKTSISITRKFKSISIFTPLYRDTGYSVKYLDVSGIKPLGYLGIFYTLINNKILMFNCFVDIYSFFCSGMGFAKVYVIVCLIT